VRPEFRPKGTLAGDEVSGIGTIIFEQSYRFASKSGFYLLVLILNLYIQKDFD